MPTPPDRPTGPATLADLAPAPYNPRCITPDALTGLTASIREYGDIAGIVFNVATGHLVAGHQRVSALRSRGAEMEHDEVGPFLRDPGTGEVFRVRLVDWPEGKERTANVVANNPAIAGTFTPEVLGLVADFRVDLPADLFAALRFDAIADLFPGEPARKEGKTGADDVPETPPTPVTQKGDLWVLGGHRIVCADSRDQQALARLMDGQTAVLYATDPPYGVGYDGTSHPLNSKDKQAGKEKGSNSRDWGDEYWDHYEDTAAYQQMLSDVFTAARAHLADDAAWYCWHASSMTAANLAAWDGAGVRYHETIIWVKPTFILGYMVWNYQMEPCLMGWVQGNRPRLNKVDELSNVWHVDWEGKKRCTDGNHPTQKPIKLFELPMLKHTRPGDLCLETFSGSGSQLMAAETTGRRCCAVERMPGFVDVAVQRWQAFTGKAATLEGDGRSFAEVAAERVPTTVAGTGAGPVETATAGV